MHSRRQGKHTWKYAALSVGALFSGYGVTLVIFKGMPNEFGPSGTLIAPGVTAVWGGLIIATTMAALIDRLAIKLIVLDVDFFLMGLLFALYLLFPRSTDMWLVAGVPVLGVPVLYGVVTYLWIRFNALRSRQR